MRFGLSEDIISKIIAVFKEYPEVKQVIIYGSRAMGNFREGSDIDLTLKGKITSETLAQIVMQIDELNTPYLFDISIFDSLKSKDLIEHIERMGQIFYEQSV